MARFTLVVLSIILGTLIAIAFIIKGLIMMKKEKLRELTKLEKRAAESKSAVKKSPVRRKKTAKKRKKR